MKKNYLSIQFLIAVFSLLMIFSFGCSRSQKKEHKYEKIKIKTNVTEKKVENNSNAIAVSPPPFSDGIFPCTDCHKDIKPNPVRRKLTEMHDDIDNIFHHDSENRWCLDCHDLQCRDSLKLANGKRLDFKQSYKLCGQCHGDKYRDWKVGVHGKRTGEWNGKKQYLLCVNCHNPHSPKFKQLKPLPPPTRQEDIH